MGFYSDKILPHVIDATCSTDPIMELRGKIVPLATGKVLEVGMGSGINLKLYDRSKIEFVWGLEPSEGMRNKAKINLELSPIEVKWLDLSAEKIPLENNSIDSVLLTYTLCCIPDWKSAMQEMFRVLKPGGQLLFCEHGQSPDLDVQKWQNRLTPLWKKIGGGCHLNRPVKDCIEITGFVIDELHNLYVDKAPRFVGYMYYGIAHKPL